jgi:MFS transporter, ACS family, hexuronate transporter
MIVGSSNHTLPSSAAVTAPVHQGFRWLVCALLFLATTINYMDRQVLGLLAPLLQKRIGWDDLQYGHIVIAFQSAYAIGLLAVGYLIDRWGTKRGYSLSIIVWSIAACLHAAARNVAGFAAARFLLGLGESGNFPSAIKTVAEWFDLRERALATGVFNSGSNVGAIIAPALVPWIAMRFGWQAAFVSLGVAGFAWVILWLIVYRPPTGDRAARVQTAPVAAEHEGATQTSVLDYEAAPAPAAPAWLRILRLLSLRQTWAFIAISVAGQPVGWFFLYWLPKFFSTRYDLSLSNLGAPLIVVYSMAMLGSVSGGFLSAVFLGRGWSTNFSRKMSLLICAVLMIPVAFATRAPNVWLATAMIGLGLFALQGWAANCYTVVSDLFPKGTIASIVGLGTMAGSLASIAYAELAGRVLEKSGDYHVLFVIAGVACPVGIILLHALVPRWDMAEPSMILPAEQTES